MKMQALVARNIRIHRVKCGLSQESLAVDAAIDRTYVSRLERGLENPTIGVLERIAEALGIAMGDFFLPVNDGPPPQNLPGGRKKKG